MKEDIKKAFEEALKFKKCQDRNEGEFCSQYIVKDDDCGDCPYFVEEAAGCEAEVIVLDYALRLFEEGKLNTL